MYREAARTVAGPPYDRAQRAFRVTNHDKTVPSIIIILATAAWTASGLDIKWLKDPWAWRAIRPAYRSDDTNMETLYHRFQQACELMRKAYENEHDTKLDWNTETPLATTWEEKSSMTRKTPWAWMDRGCRMIGEEIH